MQRKSEENQTADVRKREFGLRLRGHAAPKGFAPGEQRERGQELVCCGDRCANRRVAKCRGVRPFAPPFGVGKLEAQCSGADRCKVVGHGGHEWVVHAGSGSMCEYEACLCAGWLLHQPGHADLCVNRHRHGSWNGSCHFASMRWSGMGSKRGACPRSIAGNVLHIMDLLRLLTSPALQRHYPSHSRKTRLHAETPPWSFFQ